MQKIILIAGPTGSGKSEIALRLAKKINGEIINADSMQVYKEIKILSARPESYSNVSHYPVSYTHLTLPTKRIV